MAPHPDVTSIVPLTIDTWQIQASDPLRTQAATTLEEGGVILLPHLAFDLSKEERGFLRPDCVDAKTKSVKYTLSSGRLWGEADPRDATALAAMLKRYAESAQALVHALFPSYTPHLRTGNTSFRPVEATGRKQSLRQDDRLLHVDAFPSRPSSGSRLLRVFTNVNPDGRTRNWRLGERFENVAARFLPRIAAPLPGSAQLLEWLHITKSLRTPYDHFMLAIHDAMKRDSAYQKSAPQIEQAFAPGQSWIFFSDQVPHAVSSGQHAFEQTFSLPPVALMHPHASPLKTLERIKGIKLV